MNADAAAAGAAAAVACACATVAGRRAVERPGLRAPYAAWAAGFALFAVADGALLTGALSGWGADAFRLYYLCGGILVVAYLAVGELLLLRPATRLARLAAATMLFLTFASTAAVLAARVDAGALARAGSTPPNGALVGPWPTILAVLTNSVGTVVLVGGSLLSARRRRDPRPLLVAAGVLVVALASSATRLGTYAVFALGQAAGVLLILAGLVTRRSARRS